MISKVLLPTSRWKTPRTSHGLMLQLFLFSLRPSLVSCKYEICRLPNTFALRAVYGSLHVHFCCIYPLHCIPSCFQHSCSMHVVNFPFVAVCLLLGASDGHSHDWFGFLSRFFVRSVRARISFSFAIYSAGSHTLHSQDTASAACTTAQSTNPFAARPFFPRKQKCLSRMSEFTLPFLRVGAHSMCRAMDGADTELLRNS